MGKVLRVNVAAPPRSKAPDSVDGPSHASLQEGVKGQAITVAVFIEPVSAAPAAAGAGAGGPGGVSGSSAPPKVKRLELPPMEVLARYQVGGCGWVALCHA